MSTSQRATEGDVEVPEGLNFLDRYCISQEHLVMLVKKGSHGHTYFPDCEAVSKVR